MIELPLRIPEEGIEAGRGLLFRTPREDDTSALIEACDDLEVVRWTGVPSNYGPGEAAAFVARSARGIADGTAINLLGFEGTRLVGSFGYPRIAPEDARGELGYWVTATARGRGIATRMIAALIDFGFSGLGLERIEALVELGNPASIRTVERAGLTREGLLRSYAEISGARRDLLMFSLLPGDRRPSG